MQGLVKPSPVRRVPVHRAFKPGRIPHLTCLPARPSGFCAPEPALPGLHLPSRTRLRAASSSGPQFSHLPSPGGEPAGLAVFVSGGGSNFRAIHAACVAGAIRGRVAVVVTNAPSCGGAQFARAHDIPVLVYPGGKSVVGLTADQLVAALTKDYGVNYVVLAGYLKLIPSQLVAAFPRAMLNIHPGLLPAFGGPGLYGRRVHAAVLAAGARLSGPTVHFVDEEYDTGPILAQTCVPASPLDTPESLAARVLVEEHKLYPKCVAALCDGRISWTEDGMPILWTGQ